MQAHEAKLLFGALFTAMELLQETHLEIVQILYGYQINALDRLAVILNFKEWSSHTWGMDSGTTGGLPAAQDMTH